MIEICTRFRGLRSLDGKIAGSGNHSMPAMPSSPQTGKRKVIAFRVRNISNTIRRMAYTFPKLISREMRSFFAWSKLASWPIRWIPSRPHRGQAKHVPLCTIWRFGPAIKRSNSHFSAKSFECRIPLKCTSRWWDLEHRTTMSVNCPIQVIN